MKYFIKSQFILLLMYSQFTIVATELSEQSFFSLAKQTSWEKKVFDVQGLSIYGLEQMLKLGSPLKASDYQNIKSEIELIFQTEMILNDLYSKFKSKFTESEAQVLLNWFQSELGRSFVEARTNSTSAESYQLMMQKKDELLGDETRLSLAKRLINITNSVKNESKYQERIFLVVNSAIASATQLETFDIETTRKDISDRLQQNHSNFEELQTLINLFSFQNIKPQNIETYLTFMASEESVKFNQIFNEELSQILDQLIVKMFSDLNEYYKNVSAEDKKLLLEDTIN